MRKVVGLIIAALAQVVIVYAPRPANRISPAQEQGSGAQLTIAQLHDQTPAYAVDAQYPQFGISAIDAQIRQAVEQAVAEFESLTPNSPPPAGGSAAAQSQFTGTFDKVYAGPDVVSLELILSQYTGGAHPMTLFAGLNFDRATGRLLQLDDALNLIGKTVQEVSDAASAQFREEFGDAFFSEGATDNPENFSSFIISSDEVTFIFQQYQVAAYAAGAQEVSFQRVR
ncbi:MAG: DUF3298 and DUF4163 domain-containing protein [Patescibacteria group bacterium]|nr:DUF3298 and DUF4163 domain-containing protein [Patescibacteria group bacterium]